ncbi:hypothetical protein HMPREF2975_03160 [Actinomyces sp. HMSC065F12]|nr:hypothetical protein HMPREF2975_03160 [Actinomyces sp. HMSC065F12]
MLKDFREYIPAVVGAIVVIATVIGLLVPNLEGGSRSADDANNSGTTNSGTTNSGTTNSQGDYSDPSADWYWYLTDDLVNALHEGIRSGVDLYVDGKWHERSILATDRGSARASFRHYRVPDIAKTLRLKATWVDDIPNTGAPGQVTIQHEGQTIGAFTVPVGEIVEHTFDIQGGGIISVFIAAYDPSTEERVPSDGLALLTPVVTNY